MRLDKTLSTEVKQLAAVLKWKRVRKVLCDYRIPMKLKRNYYKKTESAKFSIHQNVTQLKNIFQKSAAEMRMQTWDEL